MNEEDRATVQVFDLTRELDIGGHVRLEMLADPERAAAVLQHAIQARAIRNRAGFAVANWGTGFDPRPPLEDMGDPGPPTLAALEYAWSLPDSAVTEALRNAIGAAIGRHGGFSVIRPDA